MIRTDKCKMTPDTQKLLYVAMRKKNKPANDALAPLNHGLHPKLFSLTSLNSLLHSSMSSPRMLGNHVRFLHHYNYLMDAQNANKPPLIASLDSPLKLA